MRKRKASVVLLSGGLDSCVVATMKAQEPLTDVYLLSIDYQSLPSLKEEESRNKIIKWLLNNYQNKVKSHEKVNINGYIKLRTTEKENLVPQGYPFTRDEMFMLLGASWLEKILLENEEYSEGEVTIATTKEDTLNFEDIRPEIYNYINGILNTKYSNKIGKKMIINTPLISFMKDEVIKKGFEIGAPLEYTWSCYFGDQDPCGSCDQCNWRKDAFEKAEFVDPFYKSE